MSKIIVSNRLPVTVSKDGGGIQYNKSIGGLATGLKSYHEQADSIWVGWPGILREDITKREEAGIQKTLKEEYQCLPVFFAPEDYEPYYYGFCNNTIWPLFHYFTDKVEYSAETWEAYKRTNLLFFEAIEPIIQKGDVIWIHDYQLMLLPELIKSKYPDTRIGFFLHIPFPSYEIFRLLIWREEILRGMIGADLIGFHTYGYVRHFLSSVQRLLGLDHNLNMIQMDDRYVQIDAFPMGIDYHYFASAESKQLGTETKIFDAEMTTEMKMIFSVDRLDYTKGIPDRIRAFDLFLSKNPEYFGKVTLYLVVAPSREEVSSYDTLKQEVNEMVGYVNGKYGTGNWMPIWFFYRSLTQGELILFYRKADVLLVTPLRDGMNLISKEYIAARNDYKGMVVISETAGAAAELGEAVIVNANDCEAIAEGIKTALEMPAQEMIERNTILHNRLRRYTVDFWASEFLSVLDRTVESSQHMVSQKNIDKDSSIIEKAYADAKNRIILLDYDGTLVGFASTPKKAKPDEEILALLRKLKQDRKNKIVIISGRDKDTLDAWLGELNLNLIASHGLWVKNSNESEWTKTVSIDNDWKEAVRHVLEIYTDRAPGSMIEEKEYSLAWHYRKCEPVAVATTLNSLQTTISSLIRSMNLEVLNGKKVLEIKDNRVNKGYGASRFLNNEDFDFVLAAGDDTTDEDMFKVLPDHACSIKIGLDNTIAKYQVKSYKSLRRLLVKLSNDS